MRNLAQIEQSICDRLGFLRAADLVVRALPDKAAEVGFEVFNWLSTDISEDNLKANGEIVVVLPRHTGSQSDSLGSSRNSIVSECKLFIRLKNMRGGEAGGHRVVGLIASALSGFTPNGARQKMWMRSADLIDRRDQWWIFHMTFVVPSLLIEVVDDAELARLVSVCFVGEANQTQIEEWPEQE